MSQGSAEGTGRQFRSSRKISDDIIEALRRDISTGSLAIGSRLPNERDLAQQFGVSQPTIREAVRALDAMGLVEVRHGSGVYVRGDGAFLVRAGLETMLQLAQVELLDVLDVRGVLGRQSAYLAAERATRSDLTAMETAYARLDQLPSVDTIDDLIGRIAALQVTIATAAHNPLQSTLEIFLIDLLLHLQIKALRSRGLRFWQRRATGFQADRRAIIDAIAARDPERAQSAMSDYLDHQRETFVGDKELAGLRLSDPRAVDVASEMRRVGRHAGI